LISARAIDGDAFLNGQLPPSVDRVTVTYSDHTRSTVNPIDSFLAFPIPASELAHGDLFVALRAYDHAGKQIDQRRLHIRP
jgi:hypothetical protein